MIIKINLDPDIERPFMLIEGDKYILDHLAYNSVCALVCREKGKGGLIPWNEISEKYKIKREG